MGVRSHVATFAGRLVQRALHNVLHRSGTQLPGRIALGIDPDIVAHLRGKLRRGSVVVCGTNGKTTTTNIIAAALEQTGSSVLCNHDGANMAAGVTSALLPGGGADWAALEADELSVIHILPQLRPTYLVLLNLFRDQLDRAGEIDHVQDVIVEALLATPQTILVACGDDPLCMAVAERVHAIGTRVLAFGIDEDLGVPPDRVPEARFCFRCGSELGYAYRSYAQLGAFACPSCGFARPALDFAAHKVAITRRGVEFACAGADGIPDATVRAGFGGVYMVYNLLAAWAATSLAGADATSFGRALEGYDPHNGRLQRFLVGGREVVLNLAKNPTGLNQNISLLVADERPKTVYVIINDDFNDGQDVSWIWDVDFERLCGPSDVLLAMAGGHRANDLQVRLKYAGIAAPLVEDVAQAIEAVHDMPSNVPLYVLTNYSALASAREELERMGA